MPGDVSPPVAIVGLGFVGLHLAVALLELSIPVLGIDTDAGRLRAIASGKSPVSGPEGATLKEATASGRLHLSPSYGGMEKADTVCLCVTTLLDATRRPDLAPFRQAVQGAAEHLRPGQLIVVESSVPPGSTEELVVPELERGGFRVGVDFFVACSPERLDPGNTTFPLSDTPRLVGGVTPACTDRAASFYRRFVKRVVTVSSPRVAETAKLLENTFRYVNIALVNEVAILCERMAIDVAEVVDAAATKPFGFMPFYPGPGPGGSCIPVSPFYLAWEARRHRMALKTVEAARKVNDAMAGHVVGKIVDALERPPAELAGAKVLVLGAAYKRDTPETRYSPALRVIEELMRRGISVAYHDPFVPVLEVAGQRLQSVLLTPGELARADCVAILTDHSAFDMERIMAEAKGVVIDARYSLRRGRRAASTPDWPQHVNGRLPVGRETAMG